jgi:hypothetical protein
VVSGEGGQNVNIVCVEGVGTSSTVEEGGGVGGWGGGVAVVKEVLRVAPP